MKEIKLNNKFNIGDKVWYNDEEYVIGSVEIQNCRDFPYNYSWKYTLLKYEWVDKNYDLISGDDIGGHEEIFFTTPSYHGDIRSKKEYIEFKIKSLTDEINKLTKERDWFQNEKDSPSHS